MPSSSRHLRYEGCPKCISNGRDTRNDNMSVFEDGSKHCWSCGYHQFPKHYVPRVQKEEVNAAVLPTDFSRGIPQHALQWLLQWGLPNSYWKPFIGWSEKHSRLVFTVGDGPAFSQGRYIPRELALPTGREAGTSPAKDIRKWRVWGECHKAPHILGDYQKAEGYVNDTPIILVEDIISGHKISVAGFPTICLFGTKIFDSIIPVLRHINLPVVVWLDKDQEQTMPKKCNWLSIVTGLPVNYIVTDDDPKSHSLQSVKDIINVV